MAIILENKRVAADIFLLRASGVKPGRSGQFYMLRPAGGYDPFLGRPISLFDCDGETVSFLYQAIGRGTGLLSGMLPGQRLDVQGPYGNGFALTGGDAWLIGGGIGVAPLYLLARELRRANAGSVSVYLGFRSEAFLVSEFRAVADDVHINIGGFVTEDVNFTRPGVYYACGPAPMLRAAHEASCGAVLYVSMENRMACGVGACLGCTCATVSGNKRVCKDGPVFLSREVF